MLEIAYGVRKKILQRDVGRLSFKQENAMRGKIEVGRV